MFQPNAIFVPTDFSVFSEKAFRKALDIAKHFAAKIHVLHVVRQLPLVVGDYWFDEPSVLRIQVDIEKASRDEIGVSSASFRMRRASRWSWMCRAVYPTSRS